MRTNEYDSYVKRLNNHIEDELRKKGFSLKRPSVVNPEPSVFIVRKPDGEDVKLTNKDVEFIIISTKTFGQEVDSIVRAWYPQSVQNLDVIISTLEEQWKNETNISKKRAVKEQIRTLEEKRSSKEMKLKELKFNYDEQGERLEQLYMIKYGYFVNKKIPIGYFAANMPIRFFREEMMERSYSKSNGFFEDFKNAYNFIKCLRKNYRISIANEFDKEIPAIATGFEPSMINFEPVELEGYVIREENNEAKATARLEMHPLGFELEELKEELVKKYKGSVVEISESFDIDASGKTAKEPIKSVKFCTNDSSLIGVYYKSQAPQLIVFSTPDRLEDFAGYLLETAERQK